MLIVFAIHAILYLAGGIWLIYHWKEQHDHSRPLLGLFALMMAISCVIFIATAFFATITPLTSFQAIASNLHSTEVILRIALALIYIPYALIIFIHKKSWREVSAPQPWINILSILMVVITFTFIFGMLCRIEVLMYIHVAVVDAVLLVALYMEAHVRIPVPKESATTQASVAQIALKLPPLMETGLWKNPDFTREDYCRLLGTNRLYLAHAVQSLGYTNMADMLNHYRVDYLVGLLKQYPNTNVEDLAFQAGFRNRETANRVFHDKYGCTIKAYRQEGKKENDK